jgi:hypothetical protein
VHVAASSNAGAVLALLFKCMLDWGYPEALRTDNGLDYKSKWLRRVLADLRVAHELCHPHTPEGKPFVERAFGTLSRDLLAALPGFTGANVAQGKALRERLPQARRRGLTDAELLGVELSPKDLQQQIDHYYATRHELRPHGGLPGRATPSQRALASTGARGGVEDPDALALLMSEPVPDAGNGVGVRIVGKKGIEADGGCYFAVAVATWIGEPVYASRHPSDCGVLFARNLKSGEVALVMDAGRVGETGPAVAAAARKAARAEDAKTRRDHRAREKRSGMGGRHEIVSGQRAADAAKIVYLTPPMRGDDPPAVTAYAAASEAAAGSPPPEESLKPMKPMAELRAEAAARREAEAAAEKARLAAELEQYRKDMARTWAWADEVERNGLGKGIG